MRAVSRALRRDEAAPRLVTTILFTDIVASTRRAVELGDGRWRRLLERHHSLVRGELARFGGREVDVAGDGVFASFASPTSAIACASGLGAATRRELGIELRLGLHSGECELVDAKPCGVAVHIGAAVVSEAAPGEVLVTSTVKELVSGSDFAFEDRGSRELKGIPGEWRLFAVRQARAPAPL